MYNAVAAGAITEEAAKGLRAHVAQTRDMPATDEESFRLVSSFNDIFVTIAAVLMLFAVGGVGFTIIPGLSGLLIAVAAWFMSELFTRKRRMALPSIVLLLAFIGGVIFSIQLPLEFLKIDKDSNIGVILPSLSCAIGVIAGWLHWRRFSVPITIAVLLGTAVITVIFLIKSIAAINPELTEDMQNIIQPLVFIAGLGVFAYGMRWDISDRSRETRRSDVAFWLHLLAAPMIVRPLFYWVDITNGESLSTLGIALVLVIYIIFGVIALVIDRRALLASALAYVLFAISRLLQNFGVIEFSVVLTALVIGTALLTLSAFWPNIRAVVVKKMPAGLQNRVPAII